MCTSRAIEIPYACTMLAYSKTCDVGDATRAVSRYTAVLRLTPHYTYSCIQYMSLLPFPCISMIPFGVLKSLSRLRYTNSSTLPSSLTAHEGRCDIFLARIKPYRGGEIETWGLSVRHDAGRFSKNGGHHAIPRQKLL